MDNYFDAFGRFVDSSTVTDVSFDEPEIFIFKTVADVITFNLRVIRIIEVINPYYGQALVKKTLA